ncbi:unnamed protein product [Rotaria sp. Silwood1]|nr:unnamed protein product [Rotaria sp. Silwood1]CAF1356721.1 unnamed protein product [Rotaria sp. Silwood1]
MISPHIPEENELHVLETENREGVPTVSPRPDKRASSIKNQTVKAPLSLPSTRQPPPPPPRPLIKKDSQRPIKTPLDRCEVSTMINHTKEELQKLVKDLRHQERNDEKFHLAASMVKAFCKAIVATLHAVRPMVNSYFETNKNSLFNNANQQKPSLQKEHIQWSNSGEGLCSSKTIEHSDKRIGPVFVIRRPILSTNFIGLIGQAF